MDEIIGDIDPNAARLAFEALLARLDALTEVRVASTEHGRAQVAHSRGRGRPHGEDA